MEEKHFGPVRFIPGENRGKYPYCHSVYVEGARIVIDPASDRRRLSELGEDPGVHEVWLSHWHEDHFMYLDLFDDLPLLISERDVPPLQDEDTFIAWYGIDNPEFISYWRKALKEQFNYKPRTPTETFTGGEVIERNGVTVDVISTPGHTPGHLAFFFREPEVLFMGDYDLGKFGPWYGDRDADIDQTIESVKRLRQIPAKAWITGHEFGLFEKEPAEAWDRYLNVINERESKLLDFLTEPRTMQNIVEQWIVYRKPREPRGFFEFGERALMGKHIERLMKKGVVTETERGYVKT